MHRRRFLNILGSSSIAAAFPLSLSSAFAQGPLTHRFSGEVMGGLASMSLVLEDAKQASELAVLCFKEIERLEKIFSLFRPGSSIRELNEKGRLNNPPRELVELLAEARKLSELSAGAFDVTLQPVWKYLFYLGDNRPDPARLKELQQLIDYRSVDISNEQIAFSKPKMEITLNGIAQGYITDKVSSLLKAHGIKQVLVELGETYALGRNQNNTPWRIGIKHPARDGFLRTLHLENQALATSGGYGTRFGKGDSSHHLIDPKTGSSVNYFKSVSVVASSATQADGLSTTLSLLERPKHEAVLSHYNGARAYIS